METCALCNVLETKKHLIPYEDDYCFIYTNYRPLTEGHLMIIPKRHVKLMGDLTDKESGSISRAVQLAMDSVKEVYGIEVMTLLNGWEFRTEDHLHLHTLSSEKGLYQLMEDQVVDPSRPKIEEPILQQSADKIRSWIDENRQS